MTSRDGISPAALPAARAAVKPAGTLLATLQQVTAESHQRIEATPVVAAMVAGTISVGAYAQLLAQLEVIQEAFERRVPELDIPDEPRGLVYRLAALRADLAYYAQPRLPIPAATDELRDWIVRSTHDEVIGAAYVMIGKAHGSAVVLRHLRTAFGKGDIAGVGLDYHRIAAADLRQGWVAFKSFLAAIRDANLSEISSGAVTMMTGLERLHAGIAMSA